MKKHKKIWTIVPAILIISIAILSGYWLGNVISSKNFIINKYGNISAESLRDDISAINPNVDSPQNYRGSQVFQVAEKVLIESNNYEVIGVGTIQTSLGVSQSSYTIDRRNGDDLYIAFCTYSSIIKTARQASYHINGDVNLYEGTPTCETAENVQWSDKYTNYTWEGYKETFGKYANKNCCYIVSTKTILNESEITKENGLYKCSIELDPTLSTITYAKQVGANLGVDVNTVKFNKISLTFYIDENWRFVKQEKFESYTVPYLGINLTLESTIETNFTIK